MGCDIHTNVEVRQSDGTWSHIDIKPEVFNWRDYGLFGFLADLRNYSAIPNPWPPRGWPDDVSEETIDYNRGFREGDGHTLHWITLEELKSFDYDKTFEDRRFTNGVNCGSTADEGSGRLVTYREFLPDFFFADIDRLSALGEPKDVRVLMFFDN
jgi:hypothetical protein